MKSTSIGRLTLNTLNMIQGEFFHAMRVRPDWLSRCCLAIPDWDGSQQRGNRRLLVRIKQRKPVHARVRTR